MDESPPSLGDVAAGNVKRIRSERGWTQAQLAERLAALNYPIGQPTLAKVEKGNRKISVDDAIALAIALNVPPLNLLLPDRLDAEVSLPGQRRARSLELRRWFDARGPLLGMDESEYFSGANEFDRYLHRDQNRLAVIDIVESEALAALGYTEMSAEDRAFYLQTGSQIVHSMILERDPEPETEDGEP